jgi:cold shock CspA family protein
VVRVHGGREGYKDYVKIIIKMIGRVKWFNKKGGFGFVRDLDSDEEYFVYHVDIRVKKECYRYLTEGEYVEFEIGKSQNEKYKKQAREVRGIKDNGLLCEISTKKRKVGGQKNEEEDGSGEAENQETSAEMDTSS